MKNTTVSILGGGIAGLCMAIALNKLGIKSVVFESAHQLKGVGAGLMLAPNALSALKVIGIKEQVISAGKKFDEILIKNQNGKILSHSNVRSINNQFHYLSIHRADLHKVLLNELKEDQLQLGMKSKRIKQIDNKGVEIEFDNGQFFSSQYVIVAEGIHSMIRQQLFPSVKERYAGYSCWRGICQNNELNIQQASESWGSRGRFGIIPLNHERIYWFAVINASQKEKEFEGYTPTQISEIFTEYHWPVNEIITKTSSDAIMWNPITDLKPSNNFVKSNVCFIGDAIHATTPNMGQGACIAIEDVAELFNCIQEEANLKLAFKAFEKRRLERVHFIVNQSWKIGKIAQNENKIFSAIRNTMLKLVPNQVKERQLRKVVSYP